MAPSHGNFSRQIIAWAWTYSLILITVLFIRTDRLSCINICVIIIIIIVNSHVQPNTFFRSLLFWRALFQWCYLNRYRLFLFWSFDFIISFLCLWFWLVLAFFFLLIFCLFRWFRLLWWWFYFLFLLWGL